MDDHAADSSADMHVPCTPSTTSVMTRSASLSNLAVDPFSVKGQFDGHTSSEQWLFQLQSAWMPMAACLVIFPDSLNWQPRSADATIPSVIWLTLLSFVASLWHWSDYKPGGIAQRVDVLVAGITMLSCARAHRPHAALLLLN